MVASIILSDLSWPTPDGRPLLSHITLAFGPGRTGVVGANGTGKTTLLRLIAGELTPAAGRVRVTGSIGLLRQDVEAQPDDTVADLFDAKPALALLQRAEAGLANADELADANWTLPARISSALLRCGLSVEPHAPLAALSGGQRARAGLAALIFSDPDFLLLDEPTNNLDRAGRHAVIDLLGGWRAGAIVVSHDRELLEGLDAIVELSTLGAARYGGAFSEYRARKDTQLEAARHDLAEANKLRSEIRRRAQQAAERKARKDSSGYKSRAKGDQPKVLMDAARDRAEASGGANARLRDARVDAAEAALSTACEKVEVLQPLRMDIPSTGLPPGKTVLSMHAVTGGNDPDNPVIRNLSLTITGPERIAITGPNGSGKTTLLALITGQLQPQSGVIDLRVPFAHLDQDVSLLEPDMSLADNFHRLNPQADDNQCRAALARFRFRAADALKMARCLSGGERLRAGLACTMGQVAPPSLLILDEPTNHLDLDGLGALEAALVAYDGALLVVSHDETLLDRLALDRRVELAGQPLAEDHQLSDGHRMIIDRGGHPEKS